MKNKALAVTAFLLIATTSSWLIRSQTQPKPRPPDQGVSSIRWLGFLVLGEKDSVDQIVRGPIPSVRPEIQLGLRADGVVVWRPTPGRAFGVIVPNGSTQKNLAPGKPAQGEK